MQHTMVYNTRPWYFAQTGIYNQARIFEVFKHVPPPPTAHPAVYGRGFTGQRLYYTVPHKRNTKPGVYQTPLKAPLLLYHVPLYNFNGNPYKNNTSSFSPVRDTTTDSRSRKVTYNRIFLDFNYLVLPTQEVIIKEIAIVGCTTDGKIFQQSYIVQSPSDTTDNTIVVNGLFKYDPFFHLHGIDWMDGDVTITTLRRLMKSFGDTSPVYLLDNTKIDYLKNIFFISGNIYNIEDIFVQPDLTKHLIPPPLFCDFHINKPGKVCALSNALLMNIRFDTQRYLLTLWN